MWSCGIFVSVLVLQISGGLGQDKMKIPLGGIFEASVDTEPITDEQAFHFAIELSNIEVQEYDFEYYELVEESHEHRSGPFKSTLTTCDLIKDHAFVIFGPKDIEDINAVQSVCDFKDVAHVINRWMYNYTEDQRSIINFYPHSDELNAAYFSFLRTSGWQSFTLFYEDHESLLRLGALLNMAKNSGLIVTLKQLDEGTGIYRTTLKEAVHSGEKNFVIDCRIEILEEVLIQAQQVGLITSHYHYFITNLDLQTINLEPFRHSESNITGIRIFDPQSEYAYLGTKLITDANPNFDITKMKTETALLMDAVGVLTEIISTKLSFQEVEFDDADCSTLKKSRHGFSISNSVKNSRNHGMTGVIQFDINGYRSNFNLDVIEIKEDSIAKVGTWNASKGLVTVHHEFLRIEDDSTSLKNRTFIVMTILTDPYCMLKETPSQLFGNDRFEGFAIDLIKALAEMEGFNYTFVLRDDKTTGEPPKTPDGEWSGMLGDIIYHRADLAITDLTITSDREEALDFTSPFMNLGISILAQEPKNAPPSFFSFADPFAFDTWMMLALSYIVVTVSFFILGRLSQDEWQNPYPCIEEPEFLTNQFSFSNSGWWAAGALMQQGTELGPIGISTRMLSAMWWFFVLIMVSSYTANLAAFLATENPINLFTDIESLVSNREKFGLRMGVKDGGATHRFFKGKDNPLYQQIAEYLDAHEEDRVTENKYGVANAENDNTYAFFMESISIEYEIQRHCTLKQYGKLLDDKGYGIAMRKNSTYRTRLSTAILKLQGSGEIDKLKRKWWEEQRGGGQCAAKDDDGSTPPLRVANVVGVFWVTIGGSIFSIFLVMVEFLLRAKKISKKTQVPFKEVIRIEMKAIMDLNSSVKATVRSKSKSRSKSSRTTDGTSNNNSTRRAAPYGFVPTIIKQELND